MANKVKDLKSRLDALNGAAAQLGLQHRLASALNEPMACPPETNPVLSSQFVGREEDVSKIESLLVNSTSLQHDIPVIVIVGMPGLGKTTLSKAACKSEKICEKFGKNVLPVSVSKFFEPRWILQEMLESISKDGGVNVSSEETAMKKNTISVGGKELSSCT